MRVTVAAVMGGLFLAACSSGSSGGGGGGGTVVTPTPSPSSSPTPTASYSKFADLTGDQSYPSTCNGIYMAGEGNTPGLEGVTHFEPGVLSYAAAGQTYTMGRINSGYVQTFGPADRDATVPSGTVAAYTKTVNPSQKDALALSLLKIDGAAFDYVRLVRATLQNVINSCIIGVPTRVTDIPPGTTAGYPRVAVAGTAYDSSSGTTIAYDLAKSSAALTVDLTTGIVHPAIHLIGSANGHPDKDFGNFTGEGSVGLQDGEVVNVGFDGHLNVSEPGVVVFNGAFFGPQGREFAFLLTALRYRLSTSGVGMNGFTVDAVVYGQR